MKKILILILLFSSISYADSIRCYHNGKTIYSHHIYDEKYIGDMFVFAEKGTDKVVMYSGDCLLKIDP